MKKTPILVYELSFWESEYDNHSLGIFKNESLAKVMLEYSIKYAGYKREHLDIIKKEVIGVTGIFKILTQKRLDRITLKQQQEVIKINHQKYHDKSEIYNKYFFLRSNLEIDINKCLYPNNFK